MRIVENMRQDRMRQPRHQIDHRHDDDQHQRNDVRKFPVVAARHAGRRDTGRHAADRHAARKDHRRAFVDLHAARNPEGKEPQPRTLAISRPTEGFSANTNRFILFFKPF